MKREMIYLIARNVLYRLNSWFEQGHFQVCSLCVLESHFLLWTFWIRIVLYLFLFLVSFLNKLWFDFDATNVLNLINWTNLTTAQTKNKWFSHHVTSFCFVHSKVWCCSDSIRFTATIRQYCKVCVFVSSHKQITAKFTPIQDGDKFMLSQCGLHCVVFAFAPCVWKLNHFQQSNFSGITLWNVSLLFVNVSIYVKLF